VTTAAPERSNSIGVEAMITSEGRGDQPVCSLLVASTRPHHGPTEAQSLTDLGFARGRIRLFSFMWRVTPNALRTELGAFKARACEGSSTRARKPAVARTCCSIAMGPSIDGLPTYDW